MPRGRTIQNKFTQGELDPEMLGRNDIEQYFGAAKQATNCFTVPQGGVIRRPGLKFIDNILGTVSRVTSGLTITTPNGGTGANANDDNTATELTTTTGIGTANPYVIVQYDMGSSTSVGYIRVIGARCSSGSVSSVILQGSNDASLWFNLHAGVTLDTSDLTFTVRVQEAYRYIRFARIGGTNLPGITVTLDELHVYGEGQLGNNKIINFEFNTEVTYALIITEFNIAVYKDGVYQVDVLATQLFDSKIPKLNWTQNADTLILVEETLQPIQVQRITDTSWTVSTISFDFIPKHQFTPTTTSPAANITPDGVSGTVKITASAGVFTSGDLNQIIEGNGGRARIVRYISSTVVTAYMEIPFYNTDTINSGSWELLGGFVSVWGGGNGWPRTTTFYEGRLWFGGSQNRPRTIWGSRSNLFFDFDPGTALDDDAVIVDVAGSNNELNTIVGLYGGRNLQVFTTGASYSFIRDIAQPITPTNVYLPPQSNVGAQDGLRPQEIEGVVYYVQRGGSSLRGFVYSDTENAYNALITSKISTHLIKNPISVALRKATSTDEGAYYLMVNGDGTLTVANISSIENIFAFYPATTDGLFKEVGTVFDKMYVIVERTINGSTVQFLEELTFEHLFDASVRVTTGLPAQIFSGLDHLEGETIKVRADDLNLADVTVSGGSVDIGTTATTYVEFGIDFTPILVDLPVVIVDGQNAGAIGRKKRVSQVHIRVHQTSSLTVNGRPVDFYKITNTPTTQPLTPYTGVVEKFGILGWTQDGTVTISQSTPGPFQILELSKKVNV